MLEVQVFTKTLTNFQTPQLNIVHPHNNTLNSQSTVGVTTPTLMVNNPQFQQGFQQQPPAPVPQINQQANYQVRPQQFNQQFTQPSLPQVSPLLTPPQPPNTQVSQPFNPQVPPPTFHNIHLLIVHLWAVAILLSL